MIFPERVYQFSGAKAPRNCFGWTSWETWQHQSLQKLDTLRCFLVSALLWVPGIARPKQTSILKHGASARCQDLPLRPGEQVQRGVRPLEFLALRQLGGPHLPRLGPPRGRGGRDAARRLCRDPSAEQADASTQGMVSCQPRLDQRNAVRLSFVAIHQDFAVGRGSMPTATVPLLLPPCGSFAVPGRRPTTFGREACSAWATIPGCKKGSASTTGRCRAARSLNAYHFLNCYWVGSLDFNFLGNQGVFH